MQQPSSSTDLEYEILYNPEFVPVVALGASVRIVEEKHGTRYFLRVPAKGSFYDLDKLSYLAWSLIDGKRNVQEILEESTKNDSELDPNDVYGTLLFFAEAGALEAIQEEQMWKRFKVISPFEVRLVIIRRSQKFLQSIDKYVRPALQPFLLWLTLGFVILVGLAFAGTFTGIFFDPANFRLFGEGSTVVTFFVFQFIVLMPVIAIHEICHGLTLAHYGGTPGEIGTGLFYFGPMFYVDATDSWSFSKRKRMMVMLAGVLSTVFIGSIVAVIYSLLRNSIDPFTAKVLLMTSFWCFYGSLWNLAPPFETDGYYVLADLVNIADLKRDAYDYLKSLLRRLLRLPAGELRAELRDRKKVLLGYVILSIGFMIYIIFATARFTYYMAQDVYGFVTSITTNLLASHAVPIGEWLFALVSILYFLMTISGYGVVFVTAARKAATRALKVEAIHDRDLAIYLYMPLGIREVTRQRFEDKIRSTAQKYAPTYELTWNGPLCTVVLRLGGTKLAIEQVRRHLRSMEQSFRAIYQEFAAQQRISIHRSVGIHSQTKIRLTRLFHTIAANLSLAGDKEAKNLVPQVLEREIETTDYLLSSTFTTVWTIELPPAQRDEFRDLILPSLFTEDLGVADLYGNTETFKKSVIYGFDSLASLAYSTRQKIVREVEHPEDYHVVFSFEPIKGRLLFAGRTEAIESSIDAFGPTLISQVWAGYLDNLLSEANLSLAALGYWYSTQPIEEELASLRDGEIEALWRSLSEYTLCNPLFRNILEECKADLQASKRAVRNAKGKFRTIIMHSKRVLNAFLTANTENMKSLNGRLAEFEELLGGMDSSLSGLQSALENEHLQRAPRQVATRRGLLSSYPAFLAISVILILLALEQQFWPAGLLLSLISLFTQLSYAGIYSVTIRRRLRPGRYASPFYVRLQTYLFTLTQTLHIFVATADLLRPAEITGTLLERAEPIRSENQ